jgi:hypothetical protein
MTESHPTPPAAAAANQPAAARRPWGITMTTLWTLVVLAASVLATLGALALWFPDKPVDSPDLAQDARAFAILFMAAVVAELVVLFAAARLAGWRAVDYLALHWPDRRELTIAVASVVAFVLIFDAVTYLLGRDVVTPFQLDLYRSAIAGNAALLMWITLVVAAPVGEEILFRGFLYRGWATTPRTVVPAIVVIAALWAVIHTQYDWFGILQIFLIGLLLGWVRWRSGSTLLAILLHALINAWATVQTIIKLAWL